MLSFENDYSEGAHPKLLQALTETNFVQQVGYGEDEYSLRAKDKIRAAIGDPDADIFFLVGGTQSNQVVIDGLLHSTEGVIAAATGHVNVHEAGAIEYTGHKVLTLPAHDGRIDAGELEAFLHNFYADPTYPHMVYPGGVYISHPTEYGTLYTKAELEAVHQVCKKYAIPLFLDGARLGYGLMSRETDLTLSDIARLCDVFYIGGTKVGALCGEAVVFTKNNKPPHFITSVKRRGALLAKGRLLGVQFDALFSDDLYFRIGRYAIDMAERMKEIIRKSGVRFYLESPTNQQFVILENERLKKLQEKVAVSFWEKYDETHTVIRLAASWSTTEEDLKILETAL